MTKLKAKTLKEINPFVCMVSAMYDKRAFCITTLRRKISPYYDTRIKGEYLKIKCRYTGKKVSIKFEPENGVTCALISWSTTYYNTMTFRLYFISNKEILQKLINHNLI